MTRVRLDLFSSLDGRTATSGVSPENPMGEDWESLTTAYAATRTFRERVLGDPTSGTTDLDDSYAAAHFVGVGAEIMGAAMYGLHAFPDDPQWKGWWGDQPPFGTPVFILTHTAPPLDPDVGRHDLPLPQHLDPDRARPGDRGCR